VSRTDVRTTIKRIRRQLGSGHRNEYMALDVDIDDTETTIALDADLPAGLATGAMIVIDLEQMRVRSVDRTANTADVTRGWGDSDTAAHLAGEEVAINPRFSLLDIYVEAINEIESWGPKLWYPAHTTFAIDYETETVELPTEWSELYFVLGVRRYISGSDDVTKWPALAHTSLTRSAADLLVGSAETTVLLLRLGESVSTGTLHVTVALPLSMQDRLLGEDLIDDVGIPSSAIDLLEMGVRLRLLAQGESGRSARQAQGDARQASETPVGSMVPVLAMLQRMYDRRFAIEQAKLLARNPVVMG
jgi:hypothetical protein